MNRPLLSRITLVVALSGVALTLLAGALYGVAGLMGGAVGAIVAGLNWQAIRWLTEQVTGRAVRRKGRLMILATLKTTALMAVCWIALTQLGLDARSFMIGISALVIGILVGPITLPQTDDDSNDTPNNALETEERHG